MEKIKAEHFYAAALLREKMKRLEVERYATSLEAAIMDEKVAKEYELREGDQIDWASGEIKRVPCPGSK